MSASTAPATKKAAAKTSTHPSFIEIIKVGSHIIDRRVIIEYPTNEHSILLDYQLVIPMSLFLLDVMALLPSCCPSPPLRTRRTTTPNRKLSSLHPTVLVYPAQLSRSECDIRLRLLLGYLVVCPVSLYVCSSPCYSCPRPAPFVHLQSWKSKREWKASSRSTVNGRTGRPTDNMGNKHHIQHILTFNSLYSTKITGSC